MGLNNNARSVAGLGGPETASAQYLSAEVSPTVTFRHAFGRSDTTLRLRYVGQWTAGYTETGSSANLTVSSQLTHVAEARAQLTRNTASGAKMRLGADIAYQSGGATGFTLAGNALSVANGGNGVTGRGFIGMDFSTSRGTGSAELGVTQTGQISGTAAFRVSFRGKLI